MSANSPMLFEPHQIAQHVQWVALFGQEDINRESDEHSE